MKLRKVIFISCSIIALVLFIDGLSVLATINRKAKGEINNKLGNSQFDNLIKNDNNINPVNLLILGLDEDETRSDVILLLNINPRKSKINVLSIARDTKVYIDGRTEKINALIGMNGEQLTLNEVEHLTGLPVHYYVTLNFNGFRKIIDLFGGVKMYIPFDLDYDDPVQNLHIHMKKGTQTLDGNKAEQLVRYRKGNKNGQGYMDGDIGRIKMQQEFLKEFVSQKIRLEYIHKAYEVFMIMKEYMRTNIELKDVNFYAGYLKDMQTFDLKNFTLPGASQYSHGVWYYIYDKQKTEELILNNDFR